MNVGRIVKMAVAAVVAYIVVDYVTLKYVLTGAMVSMASILSPTPPSMVAWMSVDVVAAIVLAVVFDRVRGSFGAGAKGGALFGVYAGLLVNLPIWIGMHLYLKDFSYTNAWLFTATSIVAYIAMGAAAGAAAGNETATP